MEAHVDWRSTELHWLDRRQQSGGGGMNNGTDPNGNTNSTNNNNNNNNNGQQGAPLSVFTFIIAIALFVLVVSFVLLRIFVRNRRLRRLGIYPESPIERLLGGVPREYEDTLPPPKLWHAKIADVGAHNASAQSRAEKSALGGNVGAGDVKEFGWDALMPVAAALPPSLYPVIYQADMAAAAANATQTDNANASAHQVNAGRLGRRMPNLFRRSTAEGNVNGSANAGSEAVQESNGAIHSNAQGEETIACDPEEKVSASVNVTVLIAMPSPKTVFPVTRKASANPLNGSLRRSNSKLNSGGVQSVSKSKIAEENEDPIDVDALSFKGKARRSPSLRSIRTTASVKSQGEARREAFFAQAAVMSDSNVAEQKSVLPTIEPRAYGEDDEEDELPELVFGTASVPLYAKIVPAAKAYTGRPLHSTPALISPTRSELLALVAAASEARKEPLPSPTADKLAKAEEADGEGLSAVRRSVAGTSMEGGMSATEEQNGLGDVVSRMMRTSDAPEAYELGDMSRPSLGSGPSSYMRSTSPAPTSSGLYGSMAHLGLTSAAAEPGTTEQSDLPTPTTSASERHPLFSVESKPLSPADVQSTPTGMQTPVQQHALTPQPSISAMTNTASMHTARDTGSVSSHTDNQTNAERPSTSSWQTGDEQDEVANVIERPVDIAEPQSQR